MEKLMFKVHNDTELYNFPYIGIDEFGTFLSTIGFHTGFHKGTEDEKSNRTLFWAGHRFIDAYGGNSKYTKLHKNNFLEQRYN